MKNETKIKICGLTRPEDIDYVNEMNPDYVGFVFWPNSKRAVNIAQAVELRQKLRSDIKAVGVFVNEDTDIVIELLNNRIIDLAQLHGSETEKQIHDIQCETGKPVIKAVKIKSEEDILNWLDTEADYLLLDSGMGSGETFDWDILQRISGIGKPFFLAGGLDPDNVAEAVSCVHPFAVDVSSGVETDGVKDKEKIQKFIRRVRNEQR